ncbi:polysaccharide deacetylase family protein [Mycolicibacterium sediminis]|uniref:Polysaccharide deacetylase n=1 Tax=Mycolicibacterium sediminis TaxID=1286180 RepID=A0A7I7QP90_9MYCO|nr:polysaccharide deacetylase family protein [Mycolicibacterium sediminis]BBY27860.1 polysaccharide deacetylase [Mycolicibacterium sediminis]
MLTRRNFVGTLLGVSAALAYGASATPAAAAPTGIDPDAVSALDARRTPAQWGMAMPGIVSSFAASGRQLALTLDACDRACDDALLSMLRANRVPAVLFICSKWIDDNPGRLEGLAADPLFDIGNHGTRHVPLSVTGRSAYGIEGTRSPAEVVSEVWGNQVRLTAMTGKAPTWFRTGTAHYDDVAVDIVHQLGLTPVGFTVNADDGATEPAAHVASALGGATPGSIVLAHLNHPEAGTGAGLARAVPAMQQAGWEFVPLAGQTYA